METLFSQDLLKIHHYNERYYFGEIFTVSVGNIGNVTELLPANISELSSLLSEECDNRVAYHCFYNSEVPYDVIGPNSKVKQRIIDKPFKQFQYDIFFVGFKSESSQKWYYCIAVPFVRLGVQVFRSIEAKTTNIGLKYTLVNLTDLIMDMRLNVNLDANTTSVYDNMDSNNTDPVLQLKRLDSIYTSNDYLDKVSIKGDDLLYYEDVDLFLDKKNGFTPTLCGVNFTHGEKIRPLYIMTDRRGNFKFWLGKIWIRLFTVFDVMTEFERRNLLSQTIFLPSSKLFDLDENNKDTEL